MLPDAASESAPETATDPTQVTPASGGSFAVYDAGDPDLREVLSDPFVVLSV